ncbi:DNA-directed RNA polymerase subunit alpha [bacterium (Candidatus Gribaldobacteria) CG_4_10_14_0_2_um_filter_41_16]|uniref:DNA-directed RNA polymerase subunit alpha n=3 Tax=Candidatus Gribaldobacteria TaxID=2798536 RepID=A0A2M7VIN2_9BACT|nr:MAG: DNA-directed RNA polymerase subunit alpha [Parcubacteria group bacterium CG1_02_41_26]PIR91849.1 MAG: DNA-directed RNA polymerase subunit alpha [bacterium (Candidatus Gribaldobacteria) CG10_big_fil_rev_8_21_14_0_10_41_12]PIX03436.1 MAG: DNA-directed RNA polymerase subunit alpha [bacterium (Candidatus Gribaldobacteria) CG_4_8_14_3_um_filter_42_11]PJA01519.1 MAG: DNA-directed RNA polymerase subunit alpha [bacterium (Candidatus Gribaldobacteria) CG_4_10_14_0_2_um_filter_41_16]
MIPLPLKPVLVKKEGHKAVFEIAGLYPGYGLTVGNSLRRVLLSSLKGAAITQVKIEGVSHEFSVMPGVFEDIVMLILNLKKLTFKTHSDEPQTISLSVKGEKEVKGKDFKLTSELELANPEERIATLTKPSAELKIEALVEAGIGYELAKGREIKKMEIGAMPIDAVFTPMQKVSYKVESMRVGKRTDFDLLRLEIETDGTISPEDALKKAADILLEHFSVVAKIGEEAKSNVEDILAKKVTKVKEEDAGKIKIEDAKLSERIKNVLLSNNIKTLGGLARKSESDLSGMEGLGDKAVAEIKKALKKVGLELKS